MQKLIEQHALLLMEAAIVEPIRRGSVVSLDPLLVHGRLVYEQKGRAELARLYRRYASIATNANTPCLLCTPTWRTNSERVNASGVRNSINRDAIAFLSQIRADLPDKHLIKLGGLVGCKIDCYQPHESLSAHEAESFHRWQITQMSAEEVDFLFAATLPATSEALGIARAMAATDKPYIISFVINNRGQLLDGTPLAEAIREIDSGVSRMPVGYMVNCAYPTFLCADQQPPELFHRLIGIQANASSLDHADLDCSSTLHVDDIGEWGDAMFDLHKQQGLKILGGCCGTNWRHLQLIVDLIASTKKAKGMNHGQCS